MGVKISKMKNVEEDKTAKTLKKQYAEEMSEDFDFINASSSTDCTGLIPTPPVSNAEHESYLEVYDYKPHVQNNPREKKPVK